MSDTQHRIHPGGPLHGGQLRASCDEREVVLDEGRVTEEGTHNELMELGGLYYRMFTAQAEGYLEA